MLRNTPEGGIEAPRNDVSAGAPSVMVNPEMLYYNGKTQTDTFLAALGVISPSMRRQAEDKLKNTRDYSSISIAELFESMSDQIWMANDFWGGKFANRLFGLPKNATRIPIQDTFNNRLWSYNDSGTLNHITSAEIVPLFRKGNEANWPNLILTSNHARAWRSEDLSQLMQGIERLASDGWNAPLDSCRITRESASAQTAGKNLIILACHTERDIFGNGAQLIRRRIDLSSDPNKEVPAKRTLANLSPAAVRLAKLMMKSMLEPSSAPYVDLDRAGSEADPIDWNAPFIANDPLATAHRFTLRTDAARIAQHIKLVGYSRGANTVTDALRFFYQECAALGERLVMTQPDGSVKTVTDVDIKTIISNMGILSLAPGEVPLSHAEKHVLGMRRTTIYNEHDLTAGHLINPDASEYNIWSDRLIRINGTRDDAGHNIVEALGDATRPGYIMDKQRAISDPQYQTAQDEIRAFFASNFHKRAITELCFSHEPTTRSNELYVQFAPGVGSADQRTLESELLGALHNQGFPHARAFSDLSHRRRVQIILDDNATPIEHNAAAIDQCKHALMELQAREGGTLFITQHALQYLDETARKAPPGVIVAQAARTEPRLDTSRIRG